MNSSQLNLKASLDQVSLLSEFLEETLANIPFKALMEIQVAADEVFSNIANYAYPDGEGTVKVTVNFDSSHMEMIFEDSGIPFDPLNYSGPDTSGNPDQEGGLGIMILKKLMNEVTYTRHDGVNELRLVKVWK